LLRFDRAIVVMLRRLLRPFLLWLLFVLLSVAAYMRLERPLRRCAVLMAHPRAMDYNQFLIDARYFSWLSVFLLFKSGLHSLVSAK
jgi:hypothetical protein